MATDEIVSVLVITIDYRKISVFIKFTGDGLGTLQETNPLISLVGSGFTRATKNLGFLHIKFKMNSLIRDVRRFHLLYQIRSVLHTMYVRIRVGQH